jgi:hypothetical protein
MSDPYVCSDPPNQVRPTGLTVDGVPVESAPLGCIVTATLPPHAPGPVDVSLRVGDTPYTVRSTLRYLDPGAAPEEELIERMLVPLIYAGPGVERSQWETAGALHNMSEHPLPWFNDVARPCATCAPEVAPHSSFRLESIGNDPNGLVLFVPRVLAADVQFTALVRDVSREEGSWGAELPIARESDFRTTEIILSDVTVDPRYRTTLRIYGLEGVTSPVAVTVRKEQEVIAHAAVRVIGPCEGTPCNSAEPAHAVVDIGSLVPDEVEGPVTVVVDQASKPLTSLWAFVSITNNDTQHVTVIRPQ